MVLKKKNVLKMVSFVIMLELNMLTYLPKERTLRRRIHFSLRKSQNNFKKGYITRNLFN